MRADDFISGVQNAGFTNLHFDTPWSARLFGVTLAASEKGLFTLQAFQQALIERIHEWEDGGCIETDEQYYTCWLEALQSLLQTQALLNKGQLQSLEISIAHSAQERHDHQRQGGHTIKPEAVQ